MVHFSTYNKDPVSFLYVEKWPMGHSSEEGYTSSLHRYMYLSCMHARYSTWCHKKTQHLIKWYLSVVIFSILSFVWYCRIGNFILPNYGKFHYLNRSGYCKIQLLLTLLNISLHRFWLMYDSQHKHHCMSLIADKSVYHQCQLQNMFMCLI